MADLLYTDAFGLDFLFELCDDGDGWAVIEGRYRNMSVRLPKEFLGALKDLLNNQA